MQQQQEEEEEEYDDDNSSIHHHYIICRVKFFDHKKGFGIIVPLLDNNNTTNTICNNTNDTSCCIIKDDIKLFMHQLMMTTNNKCGESIVKCTLLQLHRGMLVKAVLKPTTADDNYAIKCNMVNSMIVDDNVIPHANHHHHNNYQKPIVGYLTLCGITIIHSAYDDDGIPLSSSSPWVDTLKKNIAAAAVDDDEEESVVGSLIDDLIKGVPWIVECITMLSNEDTHRNTDDYQWFNSVFYPRVIDKAITQLLQTPYNDDTSQRNSCVKWIKPLLHSKGVYLTPNRRTRLHYALSLLQPLDDDGIGNRDGCLWQRRSIIDIKRIVNDRDDGIIVVLDGVRDIHNIAGMYRLCDALGIYQLYILSSTINNKLKMKKQADGISRRSIRYLKVTTFNNNQQQHVINDLHSRGYIILVTDLSSKSVPYHTISESRVVSGRLAIVFGQESCGISNIMKDNADISCYIPLYGVVESLNITTAAAILLEYIMNIRRKNNMIIPLNDDDKASLTNVLNFYCNHHRSNNQ